MPHARLICTSRKSVVGRGGLAFSHSHLKPSHKVDRRRLSSTSSSGMPHNINGNASRALLTYPVGNYPLPHHRRGQVLRLATAITKAEPPTLHCPASKLSRVGFQDAPNEPIMGSAEWSDPVSTISARKEHCLMRKARSCSGGPRSRSRSFKPMGSGSSSIIRL